jgi:hypothetical protein
MEHKRWRGVFVLDDYVPAKETIMIKLLSSAAVFLTVMTASAYAQDTMACDEATMAKMTTDMGSMSDPAMKASKDMAMKHMGMAQTAMTAKNAEDCSAQLNMAKMSMTMKCDEASMAMMQTEMDAMADPAMKPNKDEAMKHMDLAKTSMADSKADECVGHMGEAMSAMHKKM